MTPTTPHIRISLRWSGRRPLNSVVPLQPAALGRSSLLPMACVQSHLLSSWGDANLSYFQSATYYVCEYNPPGNVIGEFAYVLFFLYVIRAVLSQSTVRMFRHKHLELYAKELYALLYRLVFVVIRYIRMCQKVSRASSHNKSIKVSSLLNLNP